MDTVHQGHRDGQPGLYHINAVDTLTQWQVVGCVETIAERHLLPVLEAMLHQFPFRIRGFHCDNGSEFINHTVAHLLEKLRVELTKSRAYRTTDNALVEGKNGAVVRKQIGHGPIAAGACRSVNEISISGSFLDWKILSQFTRIREAAKPGEPILQVPYAAPLPISALR